MRDIEIDAPAIDEGRTSLRRDLGESFGSNTSPPAPASTNGVK